jgi:hypothetical protein
VSDVSQFSFHEENTKPVTSTKWLLLFGSAHLVFHAEV